MKIVMACFIGLMLSVRAGASSGISGKVRFADGEPVAGASVVLFDVSDERLGVVAQTTTDESGQFALALRATTTGAAQPRRFHLGQSYPNPFNPSTIIPYELATPAWVRLDVFNLLGQRVATLVDAEQSAGIYTVQWDARAASGHGVAAGVYLYRLTAGGSTATRRMVLVDGLSGATLPGGVTAGTASAVDAPMGAVESLAEASVYGLAVRGDGLATYIDSAFVVGSEPVEVVLGGRGKRSAATLFDPKLITWESEHIDLNSPTTDLSSFEGAVEETIKTLCPDQADPNIDFLLHEGKGSAFKDDFLVYRITSSTYDCLSGLDGRHVSGVDLIQQIGETLIFKAVEAGIAASTSVFAPLTVAALKGYSYYSDTKFITSFAKDFLEGLSARHIQVVLLGELPEGKIVPGNQYTPLIMVKNNQSLGGAVDVTIPLHIRFRYKYNEEGEIRFLILPWAHSSPFDFGDFLVENNNAYIIIPARNVSFGVVDQKEDYVLKDREIELFIDIPESISDGGWFLDLIFWNYKTALSIADFYPRFTASVEDDHLVLDASHSILSSEKIWGAYEWSYTLDNEKRSLSNKLGPKLTVPLSELYDLVGDADSLDVILDLSVSWEELFGWIQKRETKTVSKRVALKGVEEPEVPTTPTEPDKPDTLPIEPDEPDTPPTEPDEPDKPVVGSVEPDRAALMSLYNATDGFWSNDENWGTDAPLSEWEGVTTLDGRVIRLEQASGGLGVSIPPELGNLTALEWLNLGSNGLSGSIPPELGNLTALEWLNLGSNGLSGSIPPELGNLTALVSLGLDSNGLSGSIPPELGNLTRLRWLRLGNNQLSGSIPPELGNLTALESLHLGNNQLSGSIPPELGNLTALESLNLGGNGLSGSIPPELGNLTRLRWLSLGNNQFIGCIPAELWGVASRDLDRLVDYRGLSTCAQSGDSGSVEGRAALMALFDATGGASWTYKDKWGTDAPLGQWRGVRTDLNGRVKSLYLEDNGLSGSIPPELGNLTALEVLYLRRNQLSGSIPPELGNLTALEWLDLDANELSGSIPPELGNLTALEELGLDANELSGSIPPELGNLTALEALDLSRNQLSGSIPPELGNLTRLRGLGLAQNGLSGSIPPELGNLTALVSLGLEYNWLSGSIPPELGNLTALAVLDLYNNELSGSIPPELGNLTRLRWLNLRRNQLSGSIPPELGNLIWLVSLNLYNNQLSGSIPPELGNLPRLESLNLGYNQLSGSIPPELGNLPRSVSLNLSGNQFVGTVGGDRAALMALFSATDGPNWKSKWKWGTDAPLNEWDGVETDTNGRVVGLALDYNELSGSIPPELGNLTALEALDLRRNGLSGSIPPELGNLTALASLDLYNNQLSGSIPPELGNLPRLASLNLGYNQLSGPIPSELDNLVALASLNLGRNQLSGSIPPELGNLTWLVSLYLYNNELSGSIPPELGNLTRLRWLRLGNNQLSGSIPPELGNLTSLRGLRLNDNQLSGEIPPGLGNLTALLDLFLGGNELTGVFPPELGQLAELRELSLWNNQLSGCIPALLFNVPENDLGKLRLPNCQRSDDSPTDRAALMALFNATDGPNWKSKSKWGTDAPLDEWSRVVRNHSGRVIYIALNDNQLSGSIPPELGNLTALESLDLGNNQLSGSIPSELDDLTALEVLALNDNQLSGSIPPELGYLESLEHLALRNNDLTGCIPAALFNVAINDLDELDLPTCGLSMFALSVHPDSVYEDAGETDIEITVEVTDDTAVVVDTDVILEFSYEGLNVRFMIQTWLSTLRILAGEKKATGTFTFVPINNNVADNDLFIDIRGHADTKTVAPTRIILINDDST